MDRPVNILYADGISAAGATIDEALVSFYAGRQCFAEPSHFDSHGLKLGLIPDLQTAPGQSRAFALLERLCQRLPPLPPQTRLFLATTVGAIDCLEQAPPDDEPDCTGLLLDEARRLTNLDWATLVAAACASGQTATAMAMRSLRLGHCTHALILGLDVTSAFVTGGFASLRAYTKDRPRPYDRDRNGLGLGEGVGALLLSLEHGDNALGRLLAARESCDASHITAPDSTGIPLGTLISKTLQEAETEPSALGAVIGHGTGTLHNDASELAALRRVFGDLPRPLLSIKGNIGHTLGATGVLQIAYGLSFLRRGLLPPQAGLQVPAEGAEHFVSSQSKPLASNLLLTLNVGFGGLNSAIVLEGGKP